MWGKEQIDGKLETKTETESSETRTMGTERLGLEQREGANQSFYPALKLAV